MRSQGGGNGETRQLTVFITSFHFIDIAIIGILDPDFSVQIVSNDFKGKVSLTHVYCYDEAHPALDCNAKTPYDLLCLVTGVVRGFACAFFEGQNRGGSYSWSTTMTPFLVCLLAALRIFVRFFSIPGLRVICAKRASSYINLQLYIEQSSNRGNPSPKAALFGGGKIQTKPDYGLR